VGESRSVEEINDLGAALLKVINSPDQSSRRWVYEQYDTLILGNSLVRPGSDAGVIRIDGENKPLPFSSDVTPRYCQTDPCEGGKQAVAECWRNITASAEPGLLQQQIISISATQKDRKSWGNLSLQSKVLARPVARWIFLLFRAMFHIRIRPIAWLSCLPTPIIAGVGLITDWTKMATISNMKAGDSLLLVGGDGMHLGQSIYLRDILGRSEGTPPSVDLAAEKPNDDFVREHIENGYVHMPAMIFPMANWHWHLRKW